MKYLAERGELKLSKKWGKRCLYLSIVLTFLLSTTLKSISTASRPERHDRLTDGTQYLDA